jgi:hypothetical protein
MNPLALLIIYITVTLTGFNKIKTLKSKSIFYEITLKIETNIELGGFGKPLQKIENKTI